MSAARKPSKAEIAAREQAVAEAGAAAPPRIAGAGFDALVGQDTAIAALKRALQRQRLPHALLLHGPAGVGKATCAGILAQALNCEACDFLDACGNCPSCHKVQRGLHPDVLWVAPQRGSIRLNQIVRREQGDAPPHEPIVAWVGYKAFEGRRRVVIIDDAHTMNASAQNALLKTLEEPPASSILVLITPTPGGLLPTIRSRCQSLRFQPLGTALMRDHLQTAHGMAEDEARLRAALAPGSLGRAVDLDLDDYAKRRDAAAAAVEDAHDGGAALLASAEALLTVGQGERKVDQAASAMSAVRDVLRDLLVLANGNGVDDGLLINIDRAQEWSDWAGKLAPEAIVEALVAVQRADDRLHAQPPPNVKLTVEEALIGVGAALRSV